MKLNIKNVTISLLLVFFFCVLSVISFIFYSVITLKDLNYVEEQDWKDNWEVAATNEQFPCGLHYYSDSNEEKKYWFNCFTNNESEVRILLDTLSFQSGKKNIISFGIPNIIIIGKWSS